ncbi:hypothetical protein HDU97_000428 [Phlyctochytrium planicorne]|nr:hypothetical protein HDU97_000428 [Phlyctochytrium planicorne]
MSATASLPSLQNSPSIEVVEDHHADDSITRVVLLAVDASSFSEYAVQWAMENYLRPLTDLVVLVNVRPLLATPGPFGSVYDFQEFILTAEEQQRTESHRILQDFVRLLRKNKICSKAIAMKGDPREEIVKKAEEILPDSVVIGSRGLGPVKRTLLGSVSDYCIHHVTSCPVIVVKQPAKLPKHDETTFVSSTSFANVVPSSLH